MYHFEVTKEYHQYRLDSYLSSQLPMYSRSQILKSIQKQGASRNGKIAQGKEKVQVGDQITFTFLKEEETPLIAQSYPLEILYEDEWVAILNKPIGIQVHPDKHHKQDTLVNYLLGHFGSKNLSSKGQSFRPGIVHRLDSGTSGTLLICKSNQMYDELIHIFAHHQMVREYEAICKGVVPASGEIKVYMERSSTKGSKMQIVSMDKGKFSHTSYQVIDQNNQISHVKLLLHTGRTHQIRVHMAHIGHPVIGDLVYGDTYSNRIYQASIPYLHAKRIAFTHPITKEWIDISAELPKKFRHIVQEMKENKC